MHQEITETEIKQASLRTKFNHSPYSGAINPTPMPVHTGTDKRLPPWYQMRSDQQGSGLAVLMMSRMDANFTVVVFPIQAQ